MIADRPLGLSTGRAFAVVTMAWLALALYTNERVLPPEVLVRIVGRGGAPQMTSAQLDLMQHRGRLAYLFFPIFLAVRVAVTALVLHMFSMLLAATLPYRILFRASLWGFVAVLYGMFLRTFRIDLLGSASVTQHDLGVVPDSLAALLLTPDQSMSVLYSALSLVSVHDTLWIGIVSGLLVGFSNVRLRVGLTIAGGAWAATAMARFGLHTLTVGLIG